MSRWSGAVERLIRSLFEELRNSESKQDAAPGHRAFLCPLFLFVVTRPHPASMTFPEFQRAASNRCSSGKGADAGTRGKQSRNNSAAWGQRLVPLQALSGPLTETAHLSQARRQLLAGVVSQQEPLAGTGAALHTNQGCLEHAGGADGGRRPPMSQDPWRWNPSWLKGGPRRTLSLTEHGRARRLARDNPETNPIPINPETAGHVAEQFSWSSHPAALCWEPLPNKVSCFVSSVSPRTIHFPVLDRSPFSSPGRVPFLQQRDTCDIFELFCRN